MSNSGKGGKRYGGPWYAEFRQRLVFEGNAKRSHPTLVHRLRREGKTSVIEYRFTVEVPSYESRKVTLRFERDSRVPQIHVDGPSGLDASPHRYAGEKLCIWDPDDDQSRRWVWDYGLEALIAHITVHLFREAWWRDTDEWLGPEAPHPVPGSRTREPTTLIRRV